MNREEFIESIKSQLSSFPNNEGEKAAEFFNESINDRIEDGMTEEEAIASMGTPEEIVEKAMLDMTISTLVINRMERKQLPTWAKILLGVTFPFWLPLLVAFAAVILVLYLCVWVVVLALCISCVGVAVAGIVMIALTIPQVMINGMAGAMLLGTGMVLIGISLFFALACYGAIKAAILLSQKMVRQTKKGIVRGRN